MKGWEVVIGLETHVQLATRSKIFSGASTAFGAPPNTQACPVDLALPGVLPVMNAAALECAVRFGLAVGAGIAPRSVFARKNYFYPDLPKGYQISQYETPVVAGGTLPIVWQVDGVPHEKTVRLTRAHLEEDAGKSLHEDAMRTLGGAALAGMSGIDLNRAGTPLLEIVTEPDMRSSAEAVAYARTLHGLVTWLGICDGNMQEGSFRCDANVSVRPLGQAEFGTRCEIKNLNSFRFMQQAIEYEVRRQIELIGDGGRVVQETRLYDPDRDETRSMRSKEDAHDYRYFPDPDLPPLVVDAALVERVRAALPELPGALRERFIGTYGLSSVDASALTATRGVALYFDEAARTLAERAGAAGTAAAPDRLAKLAANWVVGDVAAQLNREGLEIDACPVSPVQLAGLIALIAGGTVSGKIAREVFQAIWDERRTEPDAAQRIVASRGLEQISDSGELEGIVDAVLAANPRSVEEFRAGKEKAFNALVGQAMKATRGKANPQQVGDLLRRRLGG
jgi:aspartyl-tRNA(Asn)/glutamyl-tRNA(Gln) amidotransferase subunit B